MSALSLVTPGADGAARAEVPIASVPQIVEELRKGNLVVLVDDEDRENEGDLVFAADFVTPEKINFMATHARGLVCVTLTQAQAQRLALKPMAPANGSQHGTNFTVSIEAAEGVTTGISAADRARTCRVATRPDARATDIVQPGHIFPVVAQAGGVLMRAGHTEAGCDFTQLAGLTPAAVICEIMNADGTMSRLPDLIPFAQKHGLKIGTIADLIEYRAAHETMIERLGRRRVTLPAGEFDLVLYRDKTAGAPHVALVKGPIDAAAETLVRVHEPATLLDVLGGSSTHSWPFQKSLAAIAQAGSGVLVLLNCSQPAERVFAGFAAGDGDAERDGARQARVDMRTSGIGAQILRDLGVGRMRLLARARKMPSMAGYGLQVTGFIEQ